MNSLLQLALDAHGGIERWNRFENVAVHMLVGGMLWKAKGQDGVLDESRIEVSLRKQRGGYIDFNNTPGQQTRFAPDSVAILHNGNPVQELKEPRQSFNGHSLETQWSPLQLVYFGTYAMWEYLTIPFSFTLQGFETSEIEPWHEAGETWRRLGVTFPVDAAFHSREQVFFFDEKGLLKRIDYSVDISGGFPAAHYVFDYAEFQGIKLPTRRLVYARDANGGYVPEPLVVRNELLEVKFS